MVHEIKSILCVFMTGGGVIHLFQTALKNSVEETNKYFHFGQFLILSSVM